MLGTRPAAGQKVSEGQRITVQVSNGRTPLPDVIGKTDADATAELNKAGWFKIERRTEVPPQDFEPNEVFRTDPTAGSAVGKDRRSRSTWPGRSRPRRTTTPPSPTPSPTATATPTVTP